MSAPLSNLEVGEIYRKYGHLVLRRCEVVTRQPALAQDALQEVFVKVMRYGSELRTAEAPLRWLYRVADRCCFDLLSRTKRRAEDELSDAIMADLTAVGSDVPPELGVAARRVWSEL